MFIFKQLTMLSCTLVGINSNEPLFYPFTVSVNKCGGSCNAIDDQYARTYLI